MFPSGRYWRCFNPERLDNRLAPFRITRRTKELLKAERDRRWRLVQLNRIELEGEWVRIFAFLDGWRRELAYDPLEFHVHLKAVKVRSNASAVEGATGLVADVIERFLLTQEQRGLRGRTLSDRKSRLKRFSRDFPGRLEEVTAAGVQKWFLGLKNLKTGRLLGRCTRNNFLRVIQHFFNSPGLKGSAQSRAIAELKPIELDAPEKPIWSPDELRELLRQAQLTDHGVIPVLVLGAFAALRTSEAIRLDASRLRLKLAKLIIVSNTTKVKKKRTVPCPANLVEWLRAFAPRSGPMWVGHEATFYKRLGKLCARAGLRWRANGLRKSACTYLDLATDDARAQSRAAGHSLAMREKHYLDPEAVMDDEAPKAWFAIRPGDGIQGKLPFPEVPNESPRVVRVAFS